MYIPLGTAYLPSYVGIIINYYKDPYQTTKDVLDLFFLGPIVPWDSSPFCTTGRICLELFPSIKQANPSTATISTLGSKTKTSWCVFKDFNPKPQFPQPPKQIQAIS